MFRTFLRTAFGCQLEVKGHALDHPTLVWLLDVLSYLFRRFTDPSIMVFLAAYSLDSFSGHLADVLRRRPSVHGALLLVLDPAGLDSLRGNSPHCSGSVFPRMALNFSWCFLEGFVTCVHMVNYLDFFLLP